MSTPTAPAPPNSNLGQPEAVPPPTPIWECRISQIFWVNSVAVSDDGKRIVAGTFLHDYSRRGDKLVPNIGGCFKFCCFDDQPAEPQKNKAPFYEHNHPGWDGIYGVAVSGDGAIAAAGGWYSITGGATEGMVLAYDIRDSGAVKPILDHRVNGHRVSWVALSKDGKFLTAAADDVYLFVRDHAGFQYRGVAGIAGTAANYVTNVAVHPTEGWVAACDESGHAYLIPIDVQAGVFGKPCTLTCDQGTVPFLSVAIAANAGVFAVGGGNFVYRYDARELLAGKTPPPLKYAFSEPEVPGPKKDGSQQENVRWVAITSDGKRITAVTNRTNDDSGKHGLLVVLNDANNALNREYEFLLDSWPNSTSMNGAGTIITASDGYPPGLPAHLYCFDGGFQRHWKFPRYDMSWPMVLTPDGRFIASGCDDGNVVLLATGFTPAT